ncbi:polyadenylate-binding protein, putative [Plasmodium knowlesi strain H]|uniref:Polyadenylate-binding protein n=3 Tax=Plasmodium knowlesi TaxID=5850 RepID=A0A5K1U8S2_PLAKH|nr:polyadenylate-binding protein 1, putative [Plasmodium knowlesi strain H]OTN63974.1 Polyadenylate-binding protein [Plasmodium knowlesi]CAA9991031.1 polyadenylate-binding protein 1, putative [Plasmodium knowlesi strain H]SBO20692.1 polyadenylate-binding protein, putative [Plasmodium knowlesi strain H]SBO21121.1 polyadenylate-binding protein, putative [Plasmodium knowlesi strain H]VVS80505.1 polyadenylate-binding protein 1, putative [Plasmodium knowlesi strain H]|eukprot:XP_002262313.1 polyadenylate-binding protein, putative [Plasmodium knowlesi strain H]
MLATGTNIMHPSFSTASLYVGDLNEDVTEAVLYEIFNTVGHVSSIRVCRDSVTRKSLGYAYVNYHNLADAERALDTLNYTNIKGQPARLMWSHRDPSLRKSGAGNIFVKNLDKSIDNKALFDTFSMFGNILSCKVATDEFGKSKSYGFVHYEDEESAKEAIEKVNGIQLGSKNVYVGHFIKRSERATNDTKFTNLYVKNFPDSVTEAHLKQLFSPYGEITSMIVKTDNKNRKFCFINYADSESAKNAMENLNGKKITDDGQIDHTYDAKKEEAENANANNGTNNGIATGADANGVEGEVGKGTTVDGKGDNKVSTAGDTGKSGEETEGGANTTGATSESVKGNEGNKVESDDKANETSGVTSTDGASNVKEDGASSIAANAAAQGESTNGINKKDSGSESADSPNILYVGPHQSRARRHAILKAKFDNLNMESKNKHQGVNLYIKNLDDAIDDQTLKELFEPYGTITSAKVMRDDKEQSKGFGFVCFAQQEEANKAVTEMHLKIINGKPLYVGLAEKREQRLSRLQQRFRMHPIRHHMNNALNSPMQYPNPQSPQLQFNQNTLNYGRPVLTPFNQNNLISWRHQQAAQQQVVHQQAAQQQLNFNANLRGQMNQMRFYTQGGANMMNNSMNQNKVNAQLHPGHQYPNALGQGNPQQPNLSAPGQHNNNQAMQQQPANNQMLNNNMRNMNNRASRNMGAGNIANIPNQKQLPINMVGKQNTSQGSQMNHQGPPPPQQQQGQGSPQQQQTQQKSPQQMQQQVPPNGNFKFTSQARNRMEMPNKNANKVNAINNMNVNFNNSSTLTAAALASAPPSMQKQVLGENLFPLVANYHPTLAGKITGMMLEMDNSELLILLENEEQLKKKIDEALVVLQKAK